MQTEKQHQKSAETVKQAAPSPDIADGFFDGDGRSPASRDATAASNDASAPIDEEGSGTAGAKSDATSLECELKEKLASAEARAAEMQEAFLRARADSENFRRRAQEDLARAHKFAIEGFAESLVPVKDSLEAALKIETPTLESIREGVEMTLKQLNAAFEKNRLTEICPQRGEKLDPMKHQAISMIPVDQNPNTIISVLQKGYMIADRLLRPALVTVAQ
jgi:molecular chaperone GrpE